MKNTNSFARSVKDEIASRQYSNERLTAILSAFTRLNGSLTIRNKQEFITFKIENSKIAKFIYSSIQNLFCISPSISYLKKARFAQNTCYVVSLKNVNYLEKLHINFLENKIDKIFAKNMESIGGYLAGAFLASGSVNSPHSSNYHLEIAFNNANAAKWFIHLMNRYDGAQFLAKVAKRRDKFIVYLKRSDQIVDFLVLIGATDACLYFENQRVDRDVSNITNRLKNLDTANLAKTLKTAENDIKIINRLIKKKGLMNLGSEKTVMLCSLRVKYPEASLEELADQLSKELGTSITKSNVNHLLRAIRLEGRNI